METKGPRRTQDFHVAIIGGGLCGLALATALLKKGISYTIFEAHASFTEIDAGINIAPNAFEAFELIDPTLGELILKSATRNPSDKENDWLDVRLGAPTESFEVAGLVMDFHGPPTGSMTIRRNELLQAMAKNIGFENARFNKKLQTLEQSETQVVMKFADGTVETASLVIGCDGVHSTVRRLILEGPASRAHYSQMGGYRGIFSATHLEEAIGSDLAYSAHVFCGPSGYIIMYPIDHGANINVGVWVWKKGTTWPPNKSWILQDQKADVLKEYAAWGPTVQKILVLVPENTQFWATHHHTVKPERYFRDRVCVIGDAAHAVWPHQGRGSAMCMEDAYVMVEVLGEVQHAADITFSDSDRICATLTAYERVRKPRFESVLDSSHDVMAFWSDF